MDDIPKINNLPLETLQNLAKGRRTVGGIEGKTKAPEAKGARTAVAPKVSTGRYEQALAKIKERTATVVERQARDLEQRVMQESFPFWDDEYRGVPNPFIRSGLFSVQTSLSRSFQTDLKVASLSNYDITYAGQDLHQDDLSVWMSLLNMARNQPLAEKVRFSGYQLIKDLGWRMHSDSYRKAQESIARLKVTGIQIASKDNTEGYSGSLIREYAWADLDESGDAKWMVRFEPRVSVLFMEDTTTFLEWEIRKKIGTRHTVALWLHSFYCSHRDPIPLPLIKLHELSRASSSLSTFRRNLKTALQTLVDIGFLVSFHLVADVVHVKKRILTQRLVDQSKPKGTRKLAA